MFYREYEYKPGHTPSREHSSQKKNLIQNRQNYKAKSLHFYSKSNIHKVIISTHGFYLNLFFYS